LIPLGGGSSSIWHHVPADHRRKHTAHWHTRAGSRGSARHDGARISDADTFGTDGAPATQLDIGSGITAADDGARYPPTKPR
jgi:hypothetical protein